MLDKILLTITFSALAILIFVTGAITFHYKLPPYHLISDALTGGEAWYDQIRSSNTTHISSTKKSNAKNKKNNIYWDKNKAYNGYTLISKRYSTVVTLIDMEGKTVHTWDLSFKRIFGRNPRHIHRIVKPKIFINTAYLFPNGDLIVQYTGLGDTPYGYGIAKVDVNSKLLWNYKENAHHDFYVDQENGDVYGLTHKTISTPPPGAEGIPFPLLADFVVRLSSDGKEIKRVSILEAFLNSEFFPLLLYENTFRKWDHFHTNSVRKLEPEVASKFPAFKAGQLMISMNNPGVIAVIDMDSEKVVWAMKGYWANQHDAQFTANGHILLFDNRGLVNNGIRRSRILAIDPQNAKPVWSYTDEDFFSNIYGRVQLLGNGNYLIASSMQEKLFEVTPEKVVVWSLTTGEKHRNIFLTATRYLKEDLSFIHK